MMLSCSLRLNMCNFVQSVMLLGYYVAIHMMFDKSCDSSQVDNPLKAFGSMSWLQNRSL